MCTGQRAFKGATDHDLINAILSTHPPDVSVLQPFATNSLDRIVATCLSKDPPDRWTSPGDLWSELTLALSDVRARTVREMASILDDRQPAGAGKLVSSHAPDDHGVLGRDHLRVSSGARGRLDHPRWWAIAVPLVLAAVATVSPITIRVICLASAFVSSLLVFYRSEYGSRKIGKSLFASLAGCGKTGDFSEIRNPHYAEFKMGRV
jgi:hypothetical protein